jgi:hypothetical protein
MALRKLTLLSLVLLSLYASGQAVPSQLVESNSPATPVATILDNSTIDDGAEDQSWGRPRALQTYDLSTVLLYAQGLPELVAPKHDEVWLFTNPNTPTGWSTKYSKVKRILPASSGTVGADPNLNYAHHWPYKLHNRYYMLAQEAGDPSASNFRYYLLGKSSDGINWTWRRFLQIRQGLSLDQVAWKDISIGGVTYNYGFVSGLSGVGGLGAIRFRQDGAAGGEWAYDASPTSTALAIWTAGGWVTVPTCASIGDGSGYDFCMYRQPSCGIKDAPCPDTAKIDPQMFVTNGRHPSLHRLERHNNKYELWYHSTQTRPANDPCGPEDATDPTLDNANTLTYRQFTPPTTLTQNPATTLGPELILGDEDVNPIRCMPSMYRQSRNTPFRLEWTLDMLYSRTRDHENDPKGGTPETNAYIVRTRMEVYGSP